MNHTQGLFTFFLACLLVACSEQRERIRPVLSDEYELYSLFINHVVSSNGHRLPYRRLTLVIDSTSYNALESPKKSPSDLLIEEGGTKLYLLDFSPDTFQLAPIKSDCLENNKRRFFLNLDSIQLRIDALAPALADTLSLRYSRPSLTPFSGVAPDDFENAYAFCLSRAGFNTTFDKAMVKARYWHLNSCNGSDAYFVRKNGRWQFVTEIYWLQATADYF